MAVAKMVRPQPEVLTRNNALFSMAVMLQHLDAVRMELPRPMVPTRKDARSLMHVACLLMGAAQMEKLLLRVRFSKNFFFLCPQ